MLNVQAILNQLNVNPQMQSKVMSAYQTATELAAGVQTKEQALSDVIAFMEGTHRFLL